MNHHYGPEDRCMNCDCRPWGKWASLPCGEVFDAPFIPADPEKEYLNFMAGFAAFVAARGLAATEEKK